jgi:hypothetical protein
MNPTVADQVLVEWFADHARLEPLLADGTPGVVDGALLPSGSPATGDAG